jgi:hypothetical protein
MSSLLKNRAPLILWGAFLTVILLLGNGCAKIAEPQTPKIHIPKPGVDLTARQLADSVVLTVSFPQQNTDGTESKTLQTVELLRTTENADVIKKPGPLSEPQFIKRAVRVLSIPSSRFPDYLQDKQFVLQDRLRFTEKSWIYSSAFRYAVRFINNHNQSAGLSNQVLIAPVPIPPAPSALSSRTTEHSIDLTWATPTENMNGSKPARVAGYNIYRSEDAGKFPSTPINRDPVPNPEFQDRSFAFDKTYYYRVTVVGSRQNPWAESNPSEILSVTPRDVFPPEPPKDFSAIVEDATIILVWAPSASSDVAGYRIYRQEEGTAGRQLLTKDLLAGLSLRDSDVKSDRRYKYFIKAVDTHGNESAEVTATNESIK